MKRILFALMLLTTTAYACDSYEDCMKESEHHGQPKPGPDYELISYGDGCQRWANNGGRSLYKDGAAGTAYWCESWNSPQDIQKAIAYKLDEISKKLDKGDR